MLSDHIKRYIKLQQFLGLKFRKSEQVLSHFANFAEARGEPWVRQNTVLDWARETSSVHASRERLRIVHKFALWMQAEDDRHEVPDPGVFGRGYQRPKPHLPSPCDIRKIMAEALKLGPPGSISPHSFHTMIGLIATTGLRRSEATNLLLEDYVPDGLIIRGSKFGKSRLVPLHPSTRKAVDDYLRLRKKAAGLSKHLFIGSTGNPIHPATLTGTFIKLAYQAGVREKGESGVRLHDLRHAFAVRSLENMSATMDVGRHALALSTYMGHAKVESTYWYLEATPRLMRQIATATEGHVGRLLT